MTDSKDGDVLTGASPPYVPFRTMMNLVERMEEEGIPNRIDKSFVSNLSGGTQSHLFSSLRSLGLITADNEPTDAMRALVSMPDDRQMLVGSILADRLPWAVVLGETATHKQLVDAFTTNAPGLGVSTREKAISFYLTAARYAGIPLSRWFKASAIPAQGTRRPAALGRRKPKGPKDSQPRTENSGGVAQGEQSTSDRDMRSRYFALLLKKAEDSQELDQGLLDRIERIIGMEDATATP